MIVQAASDWLVFVVVVVVFVESIGDEFGPDMRKLRFGPFDGGSGIFV